MGMFKEVKQIFNDNPFFPMMTFIHSNFLEDAEYGHIKQGMNSNHKTYFLFYLFTPQFNTLGASQIRQVYSALQNNYNVSLLKSCFVSLSLPDPSMIPHFETSCEAGNNQIWWVGWIIYVLKLESLENIHHLVSHLNLVHWSVKREQICAIFFDIFF